MVGPYSLFLLDSCGVFFTEILGFSLYLWTLEISPVWYMPCLSIEMPLSLSLSLSLPFYLIILSSHLLTDVFRQLTQISSFTSFIISRPSFALSFPFEVFIREIMIFLDLSFMFISFSLVLCMALILYSVRLL